MKKRITLIIILCMVGILSVFVFSSYAGGPKDPELVINLDVSDTAKVVKIIAFHGKWANQPAVWIHATIKNVTDKPMQYKTKCDFTGTDHSRGFWVPKVGKPLLKPGKIGTAKFPFPGKNMPKSFTIKVVDVSL